MKNPISLEYPPSYARLLSYFFGLLITVLAAILSVGLSRIFTAQIPLFPFSLAVLAVAWMYGFRPAIIATLASLALIYAVSRGNVASIFSVAPGVPLLFTFGLFGVAAAYLVDRKGRQYVALMKTRLTLDSTLKRLELAQQAAQIGTWEWDTERKCGICSVEWFKLHGLPYAEGGVVTDDEWLERLHPEETVIPWQSGQLSGAQHGKPEPLFRVVLPSGEVRWLLAFGKSVPGSSPKLVGTVQDVTTLKQTELELRRNTEALSRSISALEQFAYATSHDLKTPLRNVSLLSELLEKKAAPNLDEDAKGLLAVIGGAARQLEAMVDGLLDYAKAKYKPTVLSPIEVTPVLEEALCMLKSVISSANAEIVYDCLPKAKAERNGLLRVFQNLISNAIKYRSDEPPRIAISWKRSGEQVIFAVSDNGIGFKSEYSELIFGLFKRLQPDEYEGAGVGLAVSQAIIDAYGGRMWAESELGKGSTFRFSLLADEQPCSIGVEE
jgi:signal transduction histidine kinase